jgi:multiple sugar transport system substrate-binding protein
VKAFEAQNPDIKVAVTAKPGEYMELLQKMIADIAAGNQPPDLFVGGYNLFNYIYNELRPTLINTFAPNQAAYKGLTDKFMPNVFKLGEIDGKQVGVPFALSNIVMFCNMNLFTAAGLSEKDIPKNWDDVIKVGKIIKSKTGKFAVGMQKIDSWPDQGIIFSNGGKLLSDDGQRVAFNSEQAVGAIAMWQSLHQQGLAQVNTDSEQEANFTAGGIAMYVSSCMKLSSIKSKVNFTLKVAEAPAFGTKPKVLPSGGAAIISFSRDKAKSPAIWKFLDFATSNEAMLIFSKTGYLAVTKAKVPVMEGQQAAYDQMKYMVPWANWPGGSTGLEIDRMYINKRTEIIHGNLDPAKTLNQLAADCNKLLE